MLTRLKLKQKHIKKDQDIYDLKSLYSLPKLPYKPDILVCVKTYFCFYYNVNIILLQFPQFTLLP